MSERPFPILSREVFLETPDLLIEWDLGTPATFLCGDSTSHQSSHLLNSKNSQQLSPLVYFWICLTVARAFPTSPF